MAELDLDAIRARVAAATPALLRHEQVRSADYYEMDGHELSIPPPGGGAAVAIVFEQDGEPETAHGDAVLFAHAYTDLTALLDRVAELERELAAAKEQIVYLQGHIDDEGARMRSAVEGAAGDAAYAQWQADGSPRHG